MPCLQQTVYSMPVRPPDSKIVFSNPSFILEKLWIKVEELMTFMKLVILLQCESCFITGTYNESHRLTDTQLVQLFFFLQYIFTQLRCYKFSKTWCDCYIWHSLMWLLHLTQPDVIATFDTARCDSTFDTVWSDWYIWHSLMWLIHLTQPDVIVTDWQSLVCRWPSGTSSKECVLPGHRRSGKLNLNATNSFQSTNSKCPFLLRKTVKRTLK